MGHLKPHLINRERLNVKAHGNPQQAGNASYWVAVETEWCGRAFKHVSDSPISLNQTLCLMGNREKSAEMTDSTRHVVLCLVSNNMLILFQGNLACTQCRRQGKLTGWNTAPLPN